MALSKEISKTVLIADFIKGCKIGFNTNTGHHYGYTKEELTHLIGEILFICGLERDFEPESKSSLPAAGAVKDVWVMAEEYVMKEYGYEPTNEVITITHKAIIESAKMDFVAGYKASKPSVPVQPVEKGEGGKIKTLEGIIELKEKERQEWADMCIKKQARIEELESQLRLAEFNNGLDSLD